MWLGKAKIKKASSEFFGFFEIILVAHPKSHNTFNKFADKQFAKCNSKAHLDQLDSKLKEVDLSEC